MLASCRNLPASHRVLGWRVRARLGAVIRPGSADEQYRLAWGVRPGGAFERLAALAKWEGLAHYRPELAGVGEFGQPGKLCRVRGDHEEHRVDAELLCALSRRRGAERHEPAAVPGEAVGRLKHRPADGVHDNIEPVPDV